MHLIGQHPEAGADVHEPAGDADLETGCSERLALQVRMEHVDALHEMHRESQSFRSTRAEHDVGVR